MFNKRAILTELQQGEKIGENCTIQTGRQYSIDLIKCRLFIQKFCLICVRKASKI